MSKRMISVIKKRVAYDLIGIIILFIDSINNHYDRKKQIKCELS
jgi:hypothetical protein